MSSYKSLASQGSALINIILNESNFAAIIIKKLKKFNDLTVLSIYTNLCSISVIYWMDNAKYAALISRGREFP